MAYSHNAQHQNRLGHMRSSSFLRAFFSRFAQGASAKTVCTIRRARSDTGNITEKCSKSVFVLFALLALRAGRASIFATEPTQILNNIELVASYAEQAEQTLVQITPDTLLSEAAQQLWRDHDMSAAFKDLHTLIKAGRKLEMTARNTRRIF